MAELLNPLSKAIREIVENHSGGIKFTELMFCLLEDYPDINPYEPDFAETVEYWIHRDETLEILDYSWKMNDDYRLKMFVYQVESKEDK